MENQLFIGALTLTALSINLHAQTLVASGSYGGSNYKVYSEAGIDWSTAEANAVGAGGYLATVTSAGQDNFLAGLDPAGEYWLGGFQSPISETDATAGWTWVNGQGTFPGVNGATGFTQAYSDWAGGEPNDAGGLEQYLAIGLHSADSWNDEGDLGLISGYVVQTNSVPDGGALAIPFGLSALGLIVAHRRMKLATV